MATTQDKASPASLHPFHGFLLAGSFTLFLGTLLSDWAYSASYEIQWKNFASWLLVGALIFGGFALFWAFIDALRVRWRGRRLIYFLLLLAVWILGFINALIHAKDAWASMPDALVLSIITVLIASAASWIGLSNRRAGGTA